MINKEPAAGKVARCPTCRKPAVPEHRPFCSRRCADIDLARWLGGTFVIAGPALDAADDSTLSPASSSAGSNPADGGEDDD